ncbi:hypothetical protein BJ165DRAFT_1330281, partial [Panaeolus papilionaceus]
ARLSSPSRTNILFLLPNLRRTFSSSSGSLLRYHPAGRNNRNGGERVMFAFLDRIPQNTVFWGIMGLNAGVFLMWFMAQQKWQQERDPSAIRFMAKNFLNAWGNLVEGRIWTPLTCCFSHKDVSHILMNAFTFYFLSRNVLQMLGSRRFILLYLGGGMISSFTSMFYAMATNKAGYMSHGASGAIYSTMSFLACVAPTLTFQLYGIIPVPAWLVVTGLFGYDVYSTLSNKMGTTDTVGHIGGFLGGVAFFALMRRGRI